MENSGRINYKQLNGCNMGLTESVGINKNFLLDWKTYSLPMDNDYLLNLKWDAFDPVLVEAPAFYKFTVTISDPQEL